MIIVLFFFFFFSSRRRHTRCYRDWSSDVCSSDLRVAVRLPINEFPKRTKEIAMDCHGAGSGGEPAAGCAGVEVQKAFMLDRNYRPRILRTVIAHSGAGSASSDARRKS